MLTKQTGLQNFAEDGCVTLDDSAALYFGVELSHLLMVTHPVVAHAEANTPNVDETLSTPERTERSLAEDLSMLRSPRLETQTISLRHVTQNRTLAFFISLFAHIVVLIDLFVSLRTPPFHLAQMAGGSISVVIQGDAELDKSLTAAPPRSLETELGPPRADKHPSDDILALARRQSEIHSEPNVGLTVTSGNLNQEVKQADPDTAVSLQPKALAVNAETEGLFTQPSSQISSKVKLPIKPLSDAYPQVEQILPEKIPTPKPRPRTAETDDSKSHGMTRREATHKHGSSRGNNSENARRGVSDGQDVKNGGRSTHANKSSTSEGHAEIADYPSKVQSRLRRVVKVPANFKSADVRTTITIRLSISRDGSLAHLSLTRSSGIPTLDEAILRSIRRASPFPPLPSGWRKPGWTFNQQIQLR